MRGAREIFDLTGNPVPLRVIKGFGERTQKSSPSRFIISTQP
jgi:hypothetical protein